MGPQSILKEFKDALELLVSLREALRWVFTGSTVQGVVKKQDKEHPEYYPSFIAGRQPIKNMSQHITCRNSCGVPLEFSKIVEIGGLRCLSRPLAACRVAFKSP